MSEVRSDLKVPFTIRSALFLVIGGSALFVALLWMIGTGLGSSAANDGGNHGAGTGLNGYAAMYRLLESQRHDVHRGRSESALRQDGLLVLTPPHGTQPSELDGIIRAHRQRGPTLLILPKWRAAVIPRSMRPPDAKKGWVSIGDPASPIWSERLGQTGPLDVTIDRNKAAWTGFGLSGTLPAPEAVQTISSGRIKSLVQDSRGQTLAGILDDGEDSDRLTQAARRGRGNAPYPIVIVAEPDLLNNYGFARMQSAQLATALVGTLTRDESVPIVFDLTLNGHGRPTNMLTLAFTPPFLAATLCLLLAALTICWRAFVRFGPPRKTGRAIAFGKRALVANSAGLIRRTRRLHLLTSPYADRAVETVSRALAIGRQPDREATETAIDRALRSRTGEPASFSAVTERLRRAKAPQQAVSAARDLHALERKLIG